jgi:hypothetical protein
MAEIERLRPLAEVFRPDVRHAERPDLLASLHGNLTSIRVNEFAPENVRQLFETAKNLSLYSWFVYRFHPIARLISYSCLEAALRPLVLNDSAFPREKRRNGRPGLKDMLEHAVARKWIRNEGFDNARHLASVRAKQLKIFAQLEEMISLSLERMETREPTAEEIAAALETSTYVQGLSSSIPLIRNHIAHGNSFLDGGSVAILRIVAEAINQLYPAATSTIEAEPNDFSSD